MVATPELEVEPESPVHKWLVLCSEEFGWYPYQNEPWHWEYNPFGCREISIHPTRVICYE